MTTTLAAIMACGRLWDPERRHIDSQLGMDQGIVWRAAGSTIWSDGTAAVVTDVTVDVLDRLTCYREPPDIGVGLGKPVAVARTSSADLRAQLAAVAPCCLVCRGSGLERVCLACEGEGRRDCPACDGSGECSCDCCGHVHDCERCNGHGTDRYGTCHVCGGAKGTACASCGLPAREAEPVSVRVGGVQHHYNGAVVRTMLDLLGDGIDAKISDGGVLILDDRHTLAAIMRMTETATPIVAQIALEANEPKGEASNG